MIPILSSIIGAVTRRKRTCPKCRKSWVVPKGKERESLTCGTCGTEIPPPRE